MNKNKLHKGTHISWLLRIDGKITKLTGVIQKELKGGHLKVQGKCLKNNTYRCIISKYDRTIRQIGGTLSGL